PVDLCGGWRLVVRGMRLNPGYVSLSHQFPPASGQVLADRCLWCWVDQLACGMQCLGDLFETESVRRRPPQHREEVAELPAYGLQTAQGWRELLRPDRLRSVVKKLADDQQQLGEVLGSGPDAASLAQLRSRLDPGQ